MSVEGWMLLQRLMLLRVVWANAKLVQVQMVQSGKAKSTTKLGGIEKACGKNLGGIEQKFTGKEPRWHEV